MPREQGHTREGAPHRTSKTFKDRSNASTLQASQGGKSDLSKHVQRCDSERDSGYSEASSDDQRSSRSEHVRENGRNPSSKSANVAAVGHNPYGQIPPIYVIKNLLVKPSAPEQLLHGSLSWGGGWQGLAAAPATAKPQSQLLLIQPPAVPASPSSTSCSPSPQGPPKKGGKSYLPILNSYPRIAPHPRKDAREAKATSRAKDGKESGGEGQRQRKRACIEEEKWDCVSTTSDLQKSPRRQSRAVVSSSGRDGVGSPSVSSSQPPSSSPSPSDSPSSSSSLPSVAPSSSADASPDGSAVRQRRFLNTAEILKQSGLLAITLRTKELLKQNAATDLELAQLRQHTQMLTQMAWAGQHRSDKSSENLDKLLQAMSESGSYPGLDPEHVKVLSRTRNHEDQKKCHSTSPLVASSSQKVDDGTSPPSPLFAPSPDPTECPADPPDPTSSCVPFQMTPPE
ncbi:unnamed protein product [Ophioblennius macclurei]